MSAEAPHAAPAPSAGPAAGDAALDAAVHALAAALQARGWRMATAESCTGGGVAAACTALAGSSLWFEGALVTYSNAMKTRWLGVPEALLAAHGAVSQPVAEAMAEGALKAAGVEAAVALTGIAGPGGGTPAKPVGTVWVAAAVRRQGSPSAPVDSAVLCLHASGDRAAVRAQSVLQALRLLRERVEAQGG